MRSYPLSKAYSLAVEREHKKIRLVLLDRGQELACRKESPKKLVEFLSTDEAHLFKGRVQLNKWQDEIEIFFKKEYIGMLTKDDLAAAVGFQGA